MPAKVWQLLPTPEDIAASLQSQLGINPLFCRLLAQRGVLNYEDARRFFRPEWAHLHDPFLMADMDLAVHRILAALSSGEGILLFGDYDVDGSMGVSLLYDFLQSRHTQLDYYFPDRYKEGYGLSKEGIDYAHQKGLGLIIAIDCGIRDLEEASYARQLGIDLIVCDHHLPGENLPEAIAVLDPKRSDCTYPYSELSGAGVAFKLAQGLLRARHEDEPAGLAPLLDLLVISIAADIVPMTGENRVLAHLGLSQLNNTDRPGLKALIAQSRRAWPLSISDIVFGLAPMINAAGRLADAAQVVKLVLAADREVAGKYARVLEQRNTLRREFDRRTYQEARELWLAQPDREQRASIVLYQEHWHKGVIGIVASRIAEEFFKPTIILTRSEGTLVGSGRSVQGFDLHAALSLCADVLLSYGGHIHAAGLSMTPFWLPAFQDRFEGAVQTLMPPEGIEPRLDIAAELPLNQITPSFYRILKQFAPFGPGNPNPVFVARGVEDSGGSQVIKDEHLRLLVRQADSVVFSGIAFGRAQDFERIGQQPRFDLCFTLEENRWRQQKSLQLAVKDLSFDNIGNF